MSLVTPTAVPARAATPHENVWRAPLVPAALAVAAGMIIDRYAGPPPMVSLIAVIGCAVACFIALAGRARGLPLVYLALAGVAFGAFWHHYRRDSFPPDDVGNLAPDEPRPAAVRGYLEGE